MDSVRKQFPGNVKVFLVAEDDEEREHVLHYKVSHFTLDTENDWTDIHSGDGIVHSMHTGVKYNPRFGNMVPFEDGSLIRYENFKEETEEDFEELPDREINPETPEAVASLGNISQSEVAKLIPNLIALAQNTTFKCYREYKPLRDSIEYTIYYREPGCEKTRVDVEIRCESIEKMDEIDYKCARITYWGDATGYARS